MQEGLVSTKQKQSNLTVLPFELTPAPTYFAFAGATDDKVYFVILGDAEAS